MTRKFNKPLGSVSVTADYEVGYGKPPEKTRFQPGQSGNPKGRPKGAKTTKTVLVEERMREIVMLEAYREIAVRDGNGDVTMPVVQAVMRTLGINAAKGQHHAQRLFSELLYMVESERRQRNEEFVKGAIDHKAYWDEELKRRKALGITDLEDPLPHPDHVIIDYWNETARVIGPMTREERAAVKDVLSNMEPHYAEAKELWAAFEACEDPEEKNTLSNRIKEKWEYINWLTSLYPEEDKCVEK